MYFILVSTHALIAICAVHKCTTIRNG